MKSRRDTVWPGSAIVTAGLALLTLQMVRDETVELRAILAWDRHG
jgi:hypothetical protein